MNEAVAIPAGGTRYHVQSLLGRVVLGRAANSVSFRQDVTDGLREIAHIHENRYGFGYYRARFGDLFNVHIPHWFLVAAFATLAAVPWTPRLKWRFSLRSMLIVVTVIGVLLAVIAVSR